MIVFPSQTDSQVQQELAEKLADLISPLSEQRAVDFLRAFMRTMHREWTGIDRLRYALPFLF
jgi:hypothetical protein